MFGNIINNTTFTSPKAELYFANKIWAQNTFQSDQTFISSLRALLFNRMPNEDTLNFVYKEGRPRRVAEWCLDIIQDTTYTDRPIFIVASNYGSIASQDEKDRVISSSVNSGMEYVDKVSKLFSKQFDTMCFINKTKKHVVLFIPDMNIKKWHLIQCVILGVMPWYFPEGSTITKEEEALLYSMRKGTDDEYLKALNVIADLIDFKTEFIKSSLNGFENRYEIRRMESVRQSIQEYNNEIRRYYDCIEESIRNIRDQEIVLAGLSQKIRKTDEESELMKYFMNSKGVDLVRVNGGKIDVVCKGHLAVFNQNEAKQYILEVPQSIFYRDGWEEREYTNAPCFDDQKAFFKAVFIDKVLKIRMCAAYRMDIDRMKFDGIAGYSYGGEYDRYMPNPHIDNHGCIGTYLESFADCLQRYDYIGCLEAAVSSAMCLNLDDTTVMREFVTNIWNGRNDHGTTNTNKCVELPDGSTVTPFEAINWLKENESKEA